MRRFKMRISRRLKYKAKARDKSGDAGQQVKSSIRLPVPV
jgi:hypothetical protein